MLYPLSYEGRGPRARAEGVGAVQNIVMNGRIARLAYRLLASNPPGSAQEQNHGRPRP